MIEYPDLGRRGAPAPRALAALAAATLAAATPGCAGSATSTAGRPAGPAAGTKTTLRVTLYTWIPDNASFMSWIERGFEAANPDIDLIVRDPAKSDKYGHPDRYVSDLAYEYDKTAAALTADGEDAQDVIEVDTMILGYLSEHHAVAPLDVPASYLPAARQATTIGGAPLAVPHWTCGYFVVSEADVRRAATREQLLQILRERNTPEVDLAGNLDGSWDSLMVYLDTLHDRAPTADLGAALAAPTLDAGARADLEAIGAACRHDGKTTCADADAAAAMFARGEADALIGYSERLHPILSAAGGKVDRARLHVASAPLGQGNHPMLFTDALVRSPRCQGACADAARRFAAYYVADATFAEGLMSRDLGPTAIPRYLLPSTTTAFDTPLLAGDRLYQELKAAITGAEPFPSSGIPEAREAKILRPQVKQALGIP